MATVTSAGARIDQRTLTARMSGTEFFEGVRSKTILTLYDDREVWALLGYDGRSFELGGYAQRGFGDLDWLPDPRVEEAS